jgi:signal peptidase II
MRRPLYFALIVFAGVALDLLTKGLVFSTLAPGHALLLIPDVLHIVRAENKGVAFSLLAGRQFFILCFSAVAVGVLTWFYLRNRQRASLWLLAATALVLIGAIGNLIDRVRLGCVRDFIDFVPELPVVGHWAVFNVADACITVGVVIYLINSLFARAPDEATRQP